jgi:flavin-dependent dehydrogenase
MDFGDFPLTARNLAPGGVPVGVAPRRAALDKVLIDAAVESGAELRQRFPVHGLTFDGDRVTGVRGPGGMVERARVVIGADGRNSGVAKWVGASAYAQTPTLTCWYFSYWSGVRADGLQIDLTDHRVIFTFPTNDDLFAVFVAWPIQELRAVRADTAGQLMAVLDRVPRLSEQVRPGVARSVSTAPRSCRTSCASRTGTAGHWSVTRALTRIRSPRWASATRCATRSCSPMR